MSYSPLSRSRLRIEKSQSSMYFWRLWAAFLILILFALGGQRAHAGVTPQEIVRQASDQILSALKDDSDMLAEDPQRLYQLVDEVLVNHMDFERMSRWVLGKYWKVADVEQRIRFVAEFRRLLVRTYASALADYSGQEVAYLPLRETRIDNEVVVRTEIQQPAGPPISVHYSLYLRNGVWKAYDVRIDGISLVANYRATFGAEVRAAGIDGLIQTLSARNRQALSSL